MPTTIEAIYERGTLRLKEPLALVEGTKVEIIVVSPTDNTKPTLKPAEILAVIAALPDEGYNRHVTGREHDRTLYPKDEPVQ